MFELESGVDAKFELHDNSNKGIRHILEGVEDPVENKEDPMELIMLGGRNGEGIVTVERVNQTVTLGTKRYSGMTIVDSSRRANAPGDSGAPYLLEVSPNRYRMCCIHSFGSGNMGWAFPASVAERVLGVKFGHPSPTAVAGAAEEVRPGQPVALSGKGSKSNIEGDTTLHYQWELLDDPVHPSGVTITNSRQSEATFTAPNKAANLIFQLTVGDGVGAKASDTVTVTVAVNPPSRLTFAPNAAPGAAPREATPPPMPTGSQWDLRYDGGKIQVRIKELPDVAPEISRARVYLEAGAPPDVTGVAKPVGTNLNRWATALSSSDSQWRTGSWAVRIRFENLLGSSGYSAAKSVIAPAVPPTTTPTPEPDPTPTKPTVAPTGVTATATANSVTVRWAGVSGATGYDMQLGVIEEGGEIGYKGYSATGLR